MAPWRDPTTGPVGTRAFGWALAAHVLVAAALSISEGHDQPVADVLVFLSVAAVGLGLHGTKTDEGAWPFAHALTWVVALVSIACAGLVSPGVYLESQTPLLPFFGLNALAAAIIASYGLDLFTRARIPAWIARARRVGMLAAALGVAAWVLWACPAPRIDVWVLDQQAADALLHGRRVYGHGALAALDTYDLKRVIDTYDYPPLTLVLSTGAFALTHDTRWAQVVAFIGGAALLRVFASRVTGRPVLADLVMACALFHPSAMFVLQQAWGEPLAVPLLGAFALAIAAGRGRWAAIALGLLCALKQHLLLYLLPLALLPGVGLAGAAIAIGVVAATYAPFVWVSPRGLWESLVLHHLHNPFRPDSLSLPAMLSNARIYLPWWVGFAATAASLAVLRGLPRTFGPLLLAASLQFLLFYVLGRQAFCNYYYLLGQTWLFAAAALVRPAAEVV
jgi:hypothetical protein